MMNLERLSNEVGGYFMNELPFCTRCRQVRTPNPTLICSDCQENNN